MCRIGPAAHDARERRACPGRAAHDDLPECGKKRSIMSIAREKTQESTCAALPPKTAKKRTRNLAK